jgi:ATP-dependent RNA helicase RhlE
MAGEAVSLVCVDEHELLRAIEKFTKSSIKKVDLEAFRPDPSIEAEPIQNGRGGGQKRGGQRNGNRNNAPKNANSNNRNKRKKKPTTPSTSSGNEENKTQNSRKKRAKNPHAEKIGANLQAKLDKLDKKENRRK